MAKNLDGQFAEFSKPETRMEAKKAFFRRNFQLTQQLEIRIFGRNKKRFEKSFLTFVA